MFSETISVGGPWETITSPCLSSSVPSELTPPSATATPGTDLTFSSVSAGIVGGTEKSDLTAWRPSTATSTPCDVRSNRFLNDSSIVSVKTSVPTTNATPMTTAKPVRTDLSLRESRPRSATLFTLAHRLHQVEDALGIGAGPVVDDLAVAEDHDPVGDRRGGAARG